MGVLFKGDNLEKRIWLDVPPPEVRARVAVHVSGGQHNQSALHLAKVNEKQREAVLTVVPKSLHITRTDDLEPWINLLRNELVALSFECCHGCCFPEYAFELLNAPKLQSVCIPDDPKLLGEVAKSCISELSITICGWASPTLLFDTLASLPITKLQFFCSLAEERRCFNNPDEVGPFAFALAASCPQVTDFQMECSCPHGNQLIRRALPMLRALRKLTIRQLPDDSLEMLSGLRSISIRSAVDVQLLARRLGHAVSDILDPCNVLDAHQIGSLCRCTQLSRLFCMVKEDSEFALAHLLEKNLHLNVLALYWDHVEASPETKTKERRMRPFYATVTPRVLLRAVSRAVNLSVLCLCFIHIPLSELMSMLKYAGEQLRYFVTSIMGQDEEPLDRLECVVYVAAEHCPNLDELGICERAEELALGIEKAFRPLPHQQEYRLLDALSRLHNPGSGIVVNELQVAEVQRRMVETLSRSKAHGTDDKLERLARLPSKNICRLMAGLSRLQMRAPKVQVEVLELMIRLLDVLCS